ncbi:MULTISPECIES: polyprenyl synthetase family protein [Pseudomonas]|uniref:Geranylgeranyl pyrophosphate synthase n=2 Tax=Pseudomonadaceae TaxID=135621 RepID=A0A0D0JP26_9PSED|nr:MULTISPECIES: polyprenyl synthetase family protein [Pseudomonas]KIP88004.1 geranylgeranyl pyrophosphate synthase [Pseudomonas fulva]MCW2292696.1 geranylgeranyl diphosphate synthase type II [Pseudomonas sp. BIGb0408]NYH72734.1 geranylgeranyl diphosphate synthase type II [Pseudomonas flavescens]
MTAYATATIDSGFTEHLLQLRGAIEGRLDELLPAVSNERDLVAAAVRDGALAPGKRMRPLLLLLAANGLGANQRQALDLACAIEMVHAASLILDDMPCMDDAQIRRGRPTVHLAFGEDIAILAAVALLARAFGVVAGIEGLRPLVRTQLVEIVANTVGSQGLVQGQLQDLRDGKNARSEEEIAETNNLKTGVLFSAIMDMAYLISDAPKPVRGVLQRFAVELGHAVQLYDDLQDANPNNAKDQGKDDGKSTLLALYGEERVRERLDGHLARAQICLDEAYRGDVYIGRFLGMLFA